MRWYFGDSGSQIKQNWIIIFDGHYIIFGHFEFDISLSGIVLETVS